MMKTITVWQPWASLLAIGAKEYETRSWETNCRGPILIHAAMRKPPQQGELDWDVFNAITKAITKHYGAWRYDWHLGGTKMDSNGTDNGFDIPLGCIIAVAELVECWRITDRYYTVGAKVEEARCIKAGSKLRNIEGDEILFGDWTPGRYAWELVNVHRLKTPIPAKGRQRLWNWDETEHLVSVDPWVIGPTKIWTPKGIMSGQQVPKGKEDAVRGLEVA